MRRSQALALLIVCMVILSGCSLRNRPPVIESVTATPKDVFVGDRVRLQVVAADPDGDALTYAWSTADGSLEEVSGARATWVAAAPGRYVIRVAVTDVHGATAEGTVTVEVRSEITLPRGTEVSLRLLQDVYADSLRIGDRFPLQVTRSVVVDGYEVIRKEAYGILQVLDVKWPGPGEGSGWVILAPTRLQAADGQLVPLEAPPSAGGFGGASGAGNRNGGVTGVSFPIVAGEAKVVPAGTLLAGVVSADVTFTVSRGTVVPSAAAQVIAVERVACLGIHVADMAEYVLSIYSDGVRVEAFHTGAPAAGSALQVGDRIAGIRVGDQEYYVGNMDDLHRFERMLTPGDEVVVLVRNFLRRADVPVTVDGCYVLR